MPKISSKGAIAKWCVDHGSNLRALSKLIPMNLSYLFKINNNPNSNLSVEMIKKIYQRTLEIFGEGLKPDVYLAPFYDPKDSTSSCDSIAPNGIEQPSIEEEVESVVVRDEDFINHIDTEVNALR